MELILTQPLYDVYRKDPGTTSFVVVNPQPLADTSYIDPDLPVGLYNYYVQVVNDACSQSVPSDTIVVDVITSVGNPDAGNFKIFPNPATDRVTVKSDIPVKHLRLLDVTGRTIIDIPDLSDLIIQVAVADIPSGLYVMQIFTTSNTITRLVSVAH